MAEDPNATKQETNTDEGVEQKQKQEEVKQPEKSTSDKLKEKLTLFGKKAKEVGLKAKEQAAARLSMEGQLKAARDSLSQFLSPELEIEKQIPVQLMQGAQGIVFLSSLKASFVIGASAGAGIILAKRGYGAGWSGPCSIGLLGGQWGLNMGVQQTDFIIILRDENAVKLFSGKGQIKFGADASIAAGPIGRDAQLAVGANEKGYAATVSYSMAKGLYVGVALEGQGIAVRDDCNEKYYGKKLEVKDILSSGSDAVNNEDYDAICELLSNYTAENDQKAAVNINQNEDENENEANDEKQPL